MEFFVHKKILIFVYSHMPSHSYIALGFAVLIKNPLSYLRVARISAALHYLPTYLSPLREFNKVDETRQLVLLLPVTP